jgi:Flp pilus assembly protein TadD
MSSTRLIEIAGILLLAGIAGGCSNLPSSPGIDQSRPLTGFNQAVEVGEEANPTPKELDVRRANLLLTKAKLARSDGDLNAAIGFLESVLELDPNHAEAAHQLGVLYVESGELEAAEKHFQLALSHRETNARLHADYGYFCYLTGRTDDARRHLTRATELDPSLAKAQTNLAMLEARLGDLPSARRRFAAAGLSEAEVLNNVALASLLERDFAKAESTYQRAADLNPEIPQIQRGRSLAVHISQNAAGKAVGSAKVAPLPE